MNKFSNKSIEELGFYVYSLVDPRDGKIFYIGKGCGNRVFQHCEAALQGDEVSLKLNLIREIISLGLQVEHYILRHKLSEKEAFQIESVLIDFLTYPKFNTEQILTNIVSGHHQWDEGIKTVDEINAIYDCERIKINNNEHLLLVSLNRSFNDAKAQGGKIGNSIVEDDKLDLALDIIAKAKAKGVNLVLGSDCVAADAFSNDAHTQVVPANNIPDGWEGLDAGPETQKAFAAAIEDAKTILWNGPAGVFEFDNFTAGSRAIAEAIAKATKNGAFSLIGGGDSVACINKFGMADQVSYISTGGGALLEAIEGKILPGVAAIKGE